jgi:hypothetical protein
MYSSRRLTFPSRTRHTKQPATVIREPSVNSQTALCCWMKPLPSSNGWTRISTKCTRAMRVRSAPLLARCSSRDKADPREFSQMSASGVCAARSATRSPFSADRMISIAKCCRGCSAAEPDAMRSTLRRQLYSEYASVKQLNCKAYTPGWP